MEEKGNPCRVLQLALTTLTRTDRDTHFFVFAQPATLEKEGMVSCRKS